VDLIAVPMEVCRETINSLPQLKVDQLPKGSPKSKKLVEGKNGCTHLMELLQAMAPAVFQGVSAHQTQK